MVWKYLLFMDDNITYTTDNGVIWVQLEFSDNKYTIIFLDVDIFHEPFHRPVEGICAWA